MTVRVPVRVGNWGRHAGHALELLRRGCVVELVEGETIIGYMTPPRLPITAAIIDQAVRRSPPDQADELRRMLQGLAASGMWSYEPTTGLFVTDPPVPAVPLAEVSDVELGES